MGAELVGERDHLLELGPALVGLVALVGVEAGGRRARVGGGKALGGRQAQALGLVDLDRLGAELVVDLDLALVEDFLSSIE